MEISLRYAPVTGRLHTRYAPVRRSSPKYCYLALPLDLHVLSLPLAFILSQDQTLHCKNCSSFTFDSSSYPPPYLFIWKETHAISLFSSLQCTRALFCFSTDFSTAGFFVESGCKNTTFFNTGKIFFQKKSFKNTKSLFFKIQTTDFFCRNTTKCHPKTTQMD